MTAVIVLGGHRCGTSSIAGAIAHLGIPTALPGQDIGPSPSNPRGHFEDATLCRLHEQLLGPGRWRDPQPPITFPPPLLAKYDAHLTRRAAAARRWCIKDPRLCLLLPLLIGRLSALAIPYRIVSVARAPDAAAESLRRRQRLSHAAARRIAWLYEGGRRAQLAWLTLRPGIPILSLDYDAVLADRTSAVARLAAFLDVAPTSQAVDFLDPALRHFLPVGSIETRTAAVVDCEESAGCR